MTYQDTLAEMFEQFYGSAPNSVECLVPAGSSRLYFLMQDGQNTAVATKGSEDNRENIAFISLAKEMVSRGLPVPKIYTSDSSGRFYLQEWLGHQSLYNVVTRHGIDSIESLCAFEATVRMLAKIHRSFANEPYLHKGFPCDEMDHRAIMWDLNYFKYSFLKPLGVVFDEQLLEQDFERIASLTEVGVGTMLIMRDFQSRNVMMHHGQPHVIDFQGARRGNGLYDLASLLWQTRISMPSVMKCQLANLYFDQMGIDPDWSTLYLMALLRLLQNLGAYGFRGVIEGKSMFLSPMAAAVVSAGELVGKVSDTIALPELAKVLGVAKAKTRIEQTTSDETGILTVTVQSFSYRKGIPTDYTGNGGGYVFDCRAVHNPGRYDRYKPLTGLDRPVQEFLEEDGEITVFLSHCQSLVDASVQRYVSRGFSNLSVCFGCTGGRHRSVYSAQHMAQHLRQKYPDVKIRLIHREQNIDREL